MSIKFELQIGTDRVNVVCTGSYVLEDALYIVGLALEAAVMHKLTKILFDCKMLTGNLTTMQRYELSERVADLYQRISAGRHILIAFVGNEPLVDTQRFGEDVAVNRGVPVKATSDMQEAMDWLK